MILFFLKSKMYYCGIFYTLDLFPLDLIPLDLCPLDLIPLDFSLRSYSIRSFSNFPIRSYSCIPFLGRHGLFEKVEVVVTVPVFLL